MNNKLDNNLFERLSSLPRFPFYGLVRQNTDDIERAKIEFLKTGKSPVFTYARAKQFNVQSYRNDLNALQDDLGSLSSDKIIVELYRQKLDELGTRLALVEAIQHADDKTVTTYSANLFGQVRQSVEELESEFKEMLIHSKTFHDHSKKINAEIFVRAARELLDYYGMTEWKLKVKNRPSIKVARTRKGKPPSIYVPLNLDVSKARAARLLTHEIEVHALRTYNGENSPLALLGRGLDRYLATDEGLAVYFQQKLTEHNHKHAPGFWDAWTTVLTQNGNFIDTFNTIAKARTSLLRARGVKNAEKKGRDAAWRLCVRAYRGITNTETHGVGFLRDHIYRSGLDMVRAKIAENGESVMNTLFLGNIGLQHIQEIQSMDFPTARLPEMKSKEILRNVMKS